MQRPMFHFLLQGSNSWLSLSPRFLPRRLFLYDTTLIKIHNAITVFMAGRDDALGDLSSRDASYIIKLLALTRRFLNEIS